MGAGKNRIMVAGRDATPEFDSVFAREIPRMEGSRDCVFYPDDLSARQLLTSVNALDYNQKFSRLLYYRNHVDTNAFHVSRRPGLAGWVLAKARMFLWRIFRYQHDRMFYRQNLINTHVTSQLESQSSTTAGEIRELKARLASLENQLSTKGQNKS